MSNERSGVGSGVAGSVGVGSSVGVMVGSGVSVGVAVGSGVDGTWGALGLTGSSAGV